MKKKYKEQGTERRKSFVGYLRAIHTFSFLLSPFSLHARRGFTLLIAVLVGSILLSLGFAIYNIVSKELLFSSSGRESQAAFYAADSGVECVLFWDTLGSFATSSSATSIVCNGITGQTAPLTRGNTNDNPYTTRFEFSMSDTPGVLAAPCAEVLVQKWTNPNRTVVYSYGYNTCVLTSQRRLERGIRVQF